MVIAIALACGPDLLIADEPTTALDVTIAGQMLHLIRDLVRERSMGLILISHDLGVIAQNVERMMVMYGGLVVESGPTRDVFTRRAHPYTQGLFGSRPQLGPQERPPGGQRARLAAIPGNVPELRHMPPGCPFAGRCAVAMPTCESRMPADSRLAHGHHARCALLESAG
jgi:peptide/nickel transport system ATP-binding protein